jgi:hypothetical protein
LRVRLANNDVPPKMLPGTSTNRKGDQGWVAWIRSGFEEQLQGIDRIRNDVVALKNLLGENPALGQVLLKEEQRRFYLQKELALKTGKPMSRRGVPTSLDDLLVQVDASTLHGQVQKACARLRDHFEAVRGRLSQVFGVISDGSCLQLYGVVCIDPTNALSTNRKSCSKEATEGRMRECEDEVDVRKFFFSQPQPEQDAPLLRANQSARGRCSLASYVQCANIFSPNDPLQLLELTDNYSLDAGQHYMLSGCRFDRELCHPLKISGWQHAHRCRHDECQRHEFRAAGGVDRSEQRSAEAAEREARTRQDPSIPVTFKLPTQAATSHDANTRHFMEQARLGAIQQLVRDLRRISDSKGGGKDIVLFIGDQGRGGSARGCRSSATQAVVRILSHYFLVVDVSEAYTSQLCPRCLSATKFVGKSYRRKECTSCKVTIAEKVLPFRFDRDVGAAVNFIHIVEYALEHKGAHPPVFTHEYHQNAARTTR